MKTFVKVSLILSLILLVAGGSLCFVALSRASFDWDRLTFDVQNETYDYPVAGTFQDVKIVTKHADVQLARSSTGSCTVRAKLASRDDCTAEILDGVLTVTCTDSGHALPWYKRIWRQDDVTVTVFLPDDSYEDLKISAGSGDVLVSKELTFTSVGVKTGSGDQILFAPASSDLKVKSGSGEIVIGRMGCKTIAAVSESGDITVGSCRCDSVSATASSGSVSLSDCTVKTALTNTSSGEVVFTNVDVSELLKATSSGGDITFTGVSAGEMQITAKSGDVTGVLRETMLFDVRSDSGDVVLPASGGTARCTVRTGSGDVTFALETDEG